MDLFATMTTFVRVVEAGSFSVASKQLHISVGAVSRQIAILERDLGTTLLARNTRRMSVTAEGQDYYDRCLRILRDVGDAQNIARPDAVDGSLRVSMPVTVGYRAGAALLAPLLAKYPALRLDLRIEDRIVDLVLEDVDVAIRVAKPPPVSDEIIAHPISSWPRIIVASPTYLRRHGVPKTPAALATHEALSPMRNATTDTWMLDDGTTKTSARVKVRCSCNAGNLLRELALQGHGIALFPQWYVAEDIAARRLRHVLPAWTSEPVVIHALYRAAHRDRPRVRLLVDHLRHAYAATERFI